MGDPEQGIFGFRRIVEICEAYEASEEGEDFDSKEAVFALYGLSETDACDFAVFGFDTQRHLNIEDQWAVVAGHIEELRALVREYAQQLTDRFEIVRAGNERLQRQLERTIKDDQ